MIREIIRADGPTLTDTGDYAKAKYLSDFENFLVKTVVSLYVSAVKNDDTPMIELLNKSMTEVKPLYDEALNKMDDARFKSTTLRKKAQRELVERITDRLTGVTVGGKLLSKQLALLIKQGVLNLTGTTEHIYQQFIVKPNRGELDAHEVLNPVYDQVQYCSDKEIITGLALGSIYQTVHEMDGMFLNLRSVPEHIKYHPIIMALNVSRDFFRDNAALRACEEERLRFYHSHDKSMISLNMLAVSALCWFQINALDGEFDRVIPGTTFADAFDAEFDRVTPGITDMVDELAKQKPLLDYITDNAKSFGDIIDSAATLEALYTSLKDEGNPVVSTKLFSDTTDGKLDINYHPNLENSGEKNISLIMDRWYLLRKVSQKADALCAQMLATLGDANDENSLKAYTQATKYLGKIFNLYTQHLAEACHDMALPNIAAVGLKGVKSDLFLSAPFSVLREMASSTNFNEMDARLLFQKLSARPLQIPEALPSIIENEMIDLIVKLEMRLGGLLDTREFSNLTWDLEPSFDDFGASVIAKIAKGKVDMLASSEEQKQADMSFMTPQSLI